MPYWFLLRYYDTINNPAATSPRNITILEKIAMLEKQIAVCIDKITELDEKIKQIENGG